jgi:hypothetical protein
MIESMKLKAGFENNNKIDKTLPRSKRDRDTERQGGILMTDTTNEKETSLQIQESRLCFLVIQ